MDLLDAIEVLDAEVDAALAGVASLTRSGEANSAHMTNREPVPDFDLYRELEVDPAATTDTISAAYRSLARRHHPDLHGTAADERMRRLNLAHAWLTDPARRSRYDALRSAGGDVGHTARDPAPGSAASAATTVDFDKAETLERERVEGHAPPVTALRIARYFILCGAAVVASYLGSAALALTGVMDAWAAILSLLLGSEGAIAVAGNSVFSVLLGYLVARASLALVPTRDGGVRRPLWIIGTLAALGFTFGFPLFTAAYLVDLGTWLAAQDGLMGPIVIGVIEAAFVGATVLGAAFADRDRYGRYAVP